MAESDLFWMRRPIFEAMQYNGPDDLEDLRAWVATKNTTATETIVKDVLPYGEGFQFMTAWVWDPDHPFVGQTGNPTDWVIFYYGSLVVVNDSQFNYDYEPVPDGTPIPDPPTTAAADEGTS